MEDLLTYALVGLGLLTILLLRQVGTKISARLRKRQAHLSEARRHFVKAASLMAQARSGKLSASESRSLAETAISEADIAVELDPKDAAALIVKSLALEHLRKPEAALNTLELALSKDFSKNLSGEERADTLAKRAELVLDQAKGNRDDRIPDVLAGLQEAISLKPSNPRVHLMMGICCEKLGDKDDALVAYEQALVLDPSMPAAKAAVERLFNSSPQTSPGAPV